MPFKALSHSDGRDDDVAILDLAAKLQRWLIVAVLDQSMQFIDGIPVELLVEDMDFDWLTVVIAVPP